MAVLLKVPIRYVTIKKSSPYNSMGHLSLKLRSEYSDSFLERLVLVYLAGGDAEKVVFNKYTLRKNDHNLRQFVKTLLDVSYDKYNCNILGKKLVLFLAKELSRKTSLTYPQMRILLVLYKSD